MVIRRRRVEGELIVEQTRERATVEIIRKAAGMSPLGCAWAAGCYLIAYSGSEVAGVVGIESKVDTALMRSLAVVEPMRRRGVGAALIAAARVAAHTRGARRLYALACGTDSFLVRFGFGPVAIGELLGALRGTSLADQLAANPQALARARAFSLDLSHDGLIVR